MERWTNSIFRRFFKNPMLSQMIQSNKGVSSLANNEAIRRKSINESGESLGDLSERESDFKELVGKVVF